jgi:hypothetical protein
MKEDGLFFFSASSSSWTSSYFVGAAPCNGARGFFVVESTGEPAHPGAKSVTSDLDLFYQPRDDSIFSDEREPSGC